MMKKEKQFTRVNIPTVPTEPHRKMKAAAAMAGKSIGDWVIEAITEKLRRES